MSGQELTLYVVPATLYAVAYALHFPNANKLISPLADLLATEATEGELKLPLTAMSLQQHLVACFLPADDTIPTMVVLVSISVASLALCIP